VPFVDGGSVLLGWPGAPGCTTTGFVESVCFANTVEEKKTGMAHASNMPHSILRPCRSIRFDSKDKAGSACQYRFDKDPSRAE
jgi:hypothetical protein